MTRALLIIDIQRDYFPGGAHPLVEPEAAAAQRGRVLAAFRAAGEPVVHLQHVWDAPDATYLRPGTDGVEIHDAVEPADGEPVLRKAAPNGFVGHRPRGGAPRARGRRPRRGRDDEQHVRRRDGARRRRSRVRGRRSCTTRARRPISTSAARRSPAARVHAAFMAALGDGYASLVAADDLAGGAG